MFRREHGAWSMLLQPVVAAAIPGCQWHWTMVAALAGIVAMFLIRQPLVVLARQRYVWKDIHPETALAWRWLAGLGACSALAGVALYGRWRLELLLLMGVGAAVMTVLAVWATIRNRQRPVWLQVVSAAGLTSSCVAIAAGASRLLETWVLWLWGVMALQATAAILVVHARLDAKIHAKLRVKKPSESPFGWPYAAFAAQAALLVAVPMAPDCSMPARTQAAGSSAPSTRRLVLLCTKWRCGQASQALL